METVREFVKDVWKVFSSSAISWTGHRNESVCQFQYGGHRHWILSHKNFGGKTCTGICVKFSANPFSNRRIIGFNWFQNDGCRRLGFLVDVNFDGKTASKDFVLNLYICNSDRVMAVNVNFNMAAAAILNFTVFRYSDFGRLLVCYSPHEIVKEKRLEKPFLAICLGVGWYFVVYLLDYQNNWSSALLATVLHIPYQ